MTVMLVALEAVTVAGLASKVTLARARLTPVSVTLVPALPLAGLTLVMLGAASVGVAVTVGVVVVVGAAVALGAGDAVPLGGGVPAATSVGKGGSVGLGVADGSAPVGAVADAVGLGGGGPAVGLAAAVGAESGVGRRVEVGVRTAEVDVGVEVGLRMGADVGVEVGLRMGADVVVGLAATAFDARWLVAGAEDGDGGGGPASPVFAGEGDGVGAAAVMAPEAPMHAHSERTATTAHARDQKPACRMPPRWCAPRRRRSDE